MDIPKRCDVVVIGGGPGGSTAFATSATRGLPFMSSATCSARFSSTTPETRGRGTHVRYRRADRGDAGEISCRFTVDASGQGAVIAASSVSVRSTKASAS
jgi:hypothetical protein